MKRIQGIIVSIALAMGVLAVISAAHADDVDALVSVEWLEVNSDRDDLVILDIRSPRTSRNFYDEGHIEGAVSAPYNQGWRKTVDDVIGMLPPLPEISDHIASLGVGNDSHVVVVPFGNSSTDFAAATRVYWTFKVLGHDKVSILEGGYAAWLAEGQGLSNIPVVPKRREFTVNFRRHLVATEEDVRGSLTKDVSLVDARPTAQFEGKAKSPVVSRAGTLPGALNLRQSTLYSPRKTRFVSRKDIKASTAKIGIGDENSTIAFCNTGHWASIAWFALSEIAGRENVSLYDGSMTEWTVKDDNPVQ